MEKFHSSRRTRGWRRRREAHADQKKSSWPLFPVVLEAEADEVAGVADGGVDVVEPGLEGLEEVEGGDGGDGGGEGVAVEDEGAGAEGGGGGAEEEAVGEEGGGGRERGRHEGVDDVDDDGRGERQDEAVVVGLAQRPARRHFPQGVAVAQGREGPPLADVVELGRLLRRGLPALLRRRRVAGPFVFFGLARPGQREAVEHDEAEGVVAGPRKGRQRRRRPVGPVLAPRRERHVVQHAQRQRRHRVPQHTKGPERHHEIRLRD
mmetsp:Transcript_5646/g.17867  ORF Transcript_5646/g.17867 Transcript_5646/m.17867 type:complete len:263 (-) Transcript_5646:1264-2052(-)